jgi:hypothetical protein
VKEEPKPASAHLARIWTHIGAVVGLAAAVVTIIGFFGIHPASEKPKKIEAPAKRDESARSEPPKSNPPVSTGAAKSRGIGTFRLDGGFPAGQSFIAKTPLPASDTPGAIVLGKPGGGDESLRDAVVVAPVEMNQSVGVWRKGLQLLRGVKFTADKPTLRLSGPGVKTLDVPVDGSGRLGEDIIWPITAMFTTAEFAGPVQLGNLDLVGGLSFGDKDAPDQGKTLPLHFSMNIPKPGEVLAEFKGEFQFVGGSGDRRFVVIQVQSASNDTIAAWSTEINRFGPTILRDDRAALLDRGPYALKILYSSSAD